MWLLGALAFVVALLLSVVFHEGGHFVTAKLFGMKATQFFVGFGRTLWSTRRGETEYGFKAIPAGGFVKIVGMTPLEELEGEDDEKRAFYKFPAGRRAIVLVAGSTMHFVLTVILVFAALLIAPLPTSASVITAPSSCVSTDYTKACTSTDPAGPAKAAGLREGDRLVSIGGHAVSTFTQVRDAIQADKSGAPLAVRYERDGRTLSTVIKPIFRTQPTSSASNAKTERVPIFGINPQSKHVGPITAARKTITTLGTFISGTASSLAHFPERLSTIFSKHRDANGAVGVIGASRISGDLLTSGGDWGSRIGNFLLLVAGVNLFVGVFNLLPLLPLDGGHLAVLGFEQGRDRVRRKRGYRGPIKRVDLNKLLPATYAVVAIFATLSLVLASADLVNPIHLR